MAIFGVGAMYGGTNDVSEDFITRGIACVGWPETEAPSLHNLLKHIKTGDIVYIKSHPPTVGLIIKAVGVVIVGDIIEDSNLGVGIPVRWVWTGEDRVGRLEDKYPVRNLTIYEEYNPEVQMRVIDLLLGNT